MRGSKKGTKFTPERLQRVRQQREARRKAFGGTVARRKEEQTRSKESASIDVSFGYDFTITSTRRHGCRLLWEEYGRGTDD